MIDKDFWEEMRDLWVIREANESQNNVDSDYFGNEKKTDKIKFDVEKFDQLVASRKLNSYLEAFKMLNECDFPIQLKSLYESLIERIPVLQETINKFKDIYEPDMSQFYDYYIPEALLLAQTYSEYLDVGISRKIIEDTEKELISATNTLLIAVNDKIDEIYKFASMEVKAKAKALDSVMGQDGFVNPEYKM